MDVRDVMTSPVVSVAPDAPYKELVERLLAADVSGLPVVDEHGRLVGIVTEADLVSKEAYGGPRRRALALLADVLSGREHHWATKALGAVAGDVMTTDVLVCRPDDDVRSVVRKMLRRGVKRVPVVESGALVGILTRHDVLRTFDRPDEAVAADIERALRTDVNRPDGAHVQATVHDGVVTLAGDVRYAWDVAIVAAMVHEVPGVIDVVNRLHGRERNPRQPTGVWFGPR